MPAQQGNHLSLETPATSIRIRCNSLAERNWDANGARNRRFLGVDNGSLTHNQNSTRLVSKTRDPTRFFWRFPVLVVVERIDMAEREEIVAVCSRGRDRQVIPNLDLQLPSPTPKGAEWIEAYRQWVRG